MKTQNYRYLLCMAVALLAASKPPASACGLEHHRSGMPSVLL